jgi:hypothetical protein
MSTPTFGSKPRPETRIWLVGGPLFLERVMHGVALEIPQRNRHATSNKLQESIGPEDFLDGHNDDAFIKPPAPNATHSTPTSGTFCDGTHNPRVGLASVRILNFC